MIEPAEPGRPGIVFSELFTKSLPGVISPEECTIIALRVGEPQGINGGIKKERFMGSMAALYGLEEAAQACIYQGE